MNKLQKQIILGFAILLLGVFGWWFLKYIFYINNLTLAYWISGLVLFVFWGAALSLGMLLIDDKRILYGSFILILVGFGMFFNNEPLYYFIGLILFFLAFWGASRKIKKEEKVQVSLNFWRIWKRGLPLFITALILMISLVYYFSPGLTEMKQVEFNISRNNFNLMIKPLEGLIGKKLPEGIDLDDEADKILNKEQKEEIERSYGIKIEKKDTGKDVLYKLINFQLNNTTGPYRKFIPLGLAVGLFISLKIASIIYVALVIMLSYLILRLLLIIGFVNKETIEKEVETVKL